MLGSIIDFSSHSSKWDIERRIVLGVLGTRECALGAPAGGVHERETVLVVGYGGLWLYEPVTPE
eukprot:6771132-Lingulodinium_polyedra.AAC.1